MHACRTAAAGPQLHAVCITPPPGFTTHLYHLHVLQLAPVAQQGQPVEGVHIVSVPQRLRDSSASSRQQQQQQQQQAAGCAYGLNQPQCTGAEGACALP
jgi:uncharacterized lipoprotein YmbA